MKNEPTYYEAILHRDPESENSFMLYETWEVTKTYLASN
jgi:quinol monooxygenase YgiN